MNERIDIVPGTKYKIIQDKDSFSYGTDAIFLSNFAKPKGKIIDLGTGTGIIPLRLIDDENIEKIYGVEIQAQVARLAIKSIEMNNLEDKIEILYQKELNRRLQRTVYSYGEPTDKTYTAP